MQLYYLEEVEQTTSGVIYDQELHLHVKKTFNAEVP